MQLSMVHIEAVDRNDIFDNDHENDDHPVDKASVSVNKVLLRTFTRQIIFPFAEIL